MTNNVRKISLGILSLASLVACGPSAEHKRADSTSTAQAAQQTQLATQLAAQKDSLTRVVLQADDFIMHVDSSMSRVKGLPRNKRSDSTLDPLARQIENRKVVMARVDALVARTRATAAQLAGANRTNHALLARLADDSAMITDLNATIKRQTATIDGLSSRVDSLKNATVRLASSLATTQSSLASTQASLDTVESQHNKAFYVVGKEDDLVRRGVIVREGGANLLFAHPGRTLQIARDVDTSAFTPVDRRVARVIPMPDSTRWYRIVSRQSLDNALADGRDRNAFKGNLKIADANRFWAPSKFLVLIEQ
ncbi:MAG: hypothetical protein ABJE47_05715 [bacterium]